MLIRKIIVSTLLFLASSFVMAQPIQIEADTVELEEKTGTSSYVGNVKLYQDDMSITANQLTVFTDKQSLTKIVATGTPARFTKENSNNIEAPVIAEAENIEYNAREQVLVLSEKVLLNQGENKFTGDIIEYDLRKNIMKARGKDDDGRIRAIIQLDTIPQ